MDRADPEPDIRAGGTVISWLTVKANVLYVNRAEPEPIIRAGASATRKIFYIDELLFQPLFVSMFSPYRGYRDSLHFQEKVLLAFLCLQSS